MRGLLTSLLLGVCCFAVPVTAAADEIEGLDEATLGRILEAYVRTSAEAPVSDVEIPQLERFVRGDVKQFNVAVSSPPDQAMKGWVPLEVEVSGGGETVESGVVRVHVDPERTVVVTRRALRMGAVLTASDLILEARPESTLPRGVTEDIADSVGRRLRQSLAAGRPVVSDHTEALPAVRRGQRVKLELSHGRLKIESFGRAQQDAEAGEWVRVRNGSTKRDVTGRVSANGVVHVDL